MATGLRQAREQWLADNYAALRAKALSRKSRGVYTGEDALQDALAYCFDYIELDREDQENHAFILHKVKRLLIDEHRRECRRHDVPGKMFPLDDWDGTVDDLEDKLAALLEYEETIAKIEQMKPRQREILVARMNESYDSEIANDLGISRGAVKSRLHRARKNLGAA